MKYRMRRMDVKIELADFEDGPTLESVPDELEFIPPISYSPECMSEQEKNCRHEERPTIKEVLAFFQPEKVGGSVQRKKEAQDSRTRAVMFMKLSSIKKCEECSDFYLGLAQALTHHANMLVVQDNRKAAEFATNRSVELKRIGIF